MKKNILDFAKQFVFVTLIVVTASLVTTYIILKYNIDKKTASLDKTAYLISDQIESANLNSILAFTGEHFIFIVHQRDGRIVFESGKRTGEDAEIFSEHRDEILERMLGSQEGWITFPETEPWEILTLKKTIRFLSLDELNWVVAVELPASVTWRQLLSVYSPFVWAALLGFCTFMTLGIFFVKKDKKEATDASSKTENDLLDRPDEAQKARAYSRRLIEEAQKALNSGQSGASKESPRKYKESKPAAEKQTKEQEQKNVPKTDGTKIKDQTKALDDKEKDVKKAPPPEQSSPTDKKKPAADQKPKKGRGEKEEKEEEKKQSAIYFEKLMESRRRKKNQPDTIIGQALSKKSNRENIDK